MSELVITTGDKITVGGLDPDNEVPIEVKENFRDSSTIFINKQQAMEIIAKLQSEFKLNITNAGTYDIYPISDFKL